MPKKNILIADDDQVILDMLKEMIEREGYRVFLTSNGKEAVEAIKINPIDLAILDIKMPVMDGIEALKEIKKIDQGIEVLIMTGYADLETLKQAVSYHGAFDYILKPFKRVDILNGIQNALLKRDFASQKKFREKKLEERILQLEKQFHERTHQLRESQIKYRDIVENCNDAIVVVQDGKLKFTNSKAVELTGYRQEELMTMSFLEMVHPEDRDMVAESYKGEDFSNTFSFRALRKSGESLWVEINTVRTTWEKRQATLNVIRDITKRKQTEEELQKSKEFAEGLISSMQDGFSVLNLKTENINVNDSFCNMTGFSRDELIGVGVPHPYWPPEEYENIQKAFEKTLQGDFEDIELRFMRKNGERFSVIVSPSWLKDRKGEVISYFATIKDITERVQAEEELRKSEEKYRSLVESVEDSIYLVDRDCRYLFVNKKHLSRFGLPKDKVIGKTYGEFHSEEETREFGEKVKEVFETGRSLSYEYRSERDGGYYIRTLSPVKGPDGEIIALTVASKDITEQKRAIKQIERHNRELAILNNIATSVSSTLDLHEILDLALSNVLEIAGLNTGSIYLMDHQAEEVALATYRGASEEFAQQVRAFKMGESITGRAAQSGEPIVVGDLTKDSRVATSLVSEEGIHSFAAIPMKSKGKVQGVICIGSHEHRVFSHEEIQFYTSIANHIGIAIENARLYEETKQAEEALRNSEAQKKAILDSSIDRIRLTDKDMRIIWANQTHAKDLNMASEDIVGKVCYEVFIGRDSPCPECPAQKALKSGKTEHTVLVRPISGNTDEKMYLDSYAVPIKNESGQIVNVLQATRDITEQVLAEIRLRGSEERYRELADSITDVFFAMDANLRYTYWNKASEKLIGIAEKDAIGKSLFEIFPDSPETRKYERIYREVLKTQKTKTFMNEYHLKGKRFFFDITAYPSRDGLSVFVRDITKQKKMELAFWESEERYRSLFNGVPVGLYRTTPNGKILDANKALLEILGYPNRKTILQADTIELYVNPKDREFFQATVEKQGTIHGFETQLYRYDGPPVWIGMDARVVKNADGRVLYYEGSLRDITDRKRAEKALKESEERYRLLSENIPVVLYSALPDETSTNLLISGKVEELTGYSDKQFIENPELYSNIIYPDDKAYVWKKIEEHRKKKISLDVEYRIITKGNGVKWIRDNANPIFNEEKEIIRIDGFMEDITDRKQAQEALIESGNRFRELFNNMSSGVAVYEPINDGSDFIVKDYNKAGELISKVNKEHIVGRSALEVFPGIKQFGLFEVLQRVWKTGESEHHPVSLYQDDYLTHWAENYVYKLPSGEIVAVFDDVTERVQAEEELRCSQEQLRSLADHLQTVRENERTSIAREIHDELGQALTGLKMDLSWMAKKIPEDQKSLLDKVHSMSELTGTTLRTVQRISTELRPGLLDDLGLVAAAEWQIEEFQNRTGIRSKLTVDPEDITLDDRHSTALFRILQETLTNVARHAQATRVHVSLKEKGKHLKLRVRDNGKGITKEQISDPKSFGLIGIRERAKSCGGEVKISGRSGKGTTVVVRVTVKD